MEVRDSHKQEVFLSSSSFKKKKHTGLDLLFRYAEFLNYGDVHVKFDAKTGLKAIVAIHNLNRGPAIGGCRIATYESTDKALEDALRLGYMMSYKAAISNLPHGGAKAVIIKPAVIKNREALFEAFGDFVDSLGGRYITAMDSGTSSSDMDIIARRTRFVTCTSDSHSGDPSPATAFGVRRGIEAAVKFKLNRHDLKGIHVTIQGAGHVGYYLAKELSALGAKLTVCDVNAVSLARCVEEFGVATCAPDEIYDIPADIFAPCALGAVLNRDTIQRLRVEMIVGSSNNQLAHQKYGTILHERGILYAPDFVVNAGGLIEVAAKYDQTDLEKDPNEAVSAIYDTMLAIFERARSENRATSEIAVVMAAEKLKCI